MASERGATGTLAERLVALLHQRYDLSPKEAEVVCLILCGLTRGTAIARAQGVNARTVYHHLAAIRRKLGVQTRAGMVAKAWPLLGEALAGLSSVHGASQRRPG
ncbi:MAG: helix-turn-helix domain-containing protein [Chloroflexota bacterium]|nr:helix-turn-helix domain-containing protein [Chloroflexota bacterium]